MKGRSMVGSLFVALDQQATGPVKGGGSIPSKCLLQCRRLISRRQAPVGEAGGKGRLRSVPSTCGVERFRRAIGPRCRSRLCVGNSCRRNGSNDGECYRFHNSFSASGAQQGLLNVNSEAVRLRLHADVGKWNASRGFAPRREKSPGAPQRASTRRLLACLDVHGPLGFPPDTTAGHVCSRGERRAASWLQFSPSAKSRTIPVWGKPSRHHRPGPAAARDMTDTSKAIRMAPTGSGRSTSADIGNSR